MANAFGRNFHSQLYKLVRFSAVVDTSNFGTERVTEMENKRNITLMTKLIFKAKKRMFPEKHWRMSESLIKLER